MHDIIIDPGHGGNDPGAIGNGLIEKDFNLQISLYQYKRLKELGFNVALTRDKDSSLNSIDRISLVRNKAKHCICNHINAGGGDGLEIIKSIYNKSTEADFIAKKITEKGQNLRRVFARKNSNNLDYYYMHRETGSTTTYIIEYGFVDSTRDDPSQLKEDWIEYAESVIEAFCFIYNKKYSREETREDEKYKLLEEIEIAISKLKKLL